MKPVFLAHARGLRYPTCSETFDPASVQMDDPEQTTVISFARGGSQVRYISALDRFRDPLTGDVLLVHFDDSPLAAQLLWDIAHQLPAGRKMYLAASHSVAELLGRSYYAESFHETGEEGTIARCFIKRRPLAVEAESGLDRWSFCIPTGHGDPTVLNACVARILSLGLAEYEIILCGRPRKDFLFWEAVRIVGEDIVAPPVHITRKKNVLAQAARFPNLCILHDRVLLPENFREAVNQYGDAYPLTTFQSFWFADTWLAVPRRYSDAGVVLATPAIDFAGPRITSESAPRFEAVGMTARHPARSAFGQDYLTGSLCLCKRSVWQHMPQNEALYWQDYEDLEQSFCAAVAGIPSSINPWSFATTLSYRSIMHLFGFQSGMKKNGRVSHQRAPQELWGFPRCPHLALSESEARARLSAFASKYTGSDVLVRQATSLHGLRRYRLVACLLWNTRGDMQNLLADWHRNVLCEAAAPTELRHLQAVMESASSPARKKLIMLRHPSLLRQIYNNPFSHCFAPADAPGQNNKGRRAIGALLSALWLKYGYHHVSLRLPLRKLWRLIYQNTRHPDLQNRGKP